ncbi:MAG: hypothetical protein WBE62_02225, partial [Methylocella sp.]
LGKIETDGDNMHGGRLLSVVAFTGDQFMAHRCRGAGAVHPIKKFAHREITSSNKGALEQPGIDPIRHSISSLQRRWRRTLAADFVVSKNFERSANGRFFTRTGSNDRIVPEAR